MEILFLKLLNISIAAGWMILAVMLLRLLFHRAPKLLFPILWALVAIRLICPLSIKSIFSLIPSAETIPSDIIYANTPAIQSGISSLNSLINPILSHTLSPEIGTNVNPVQIVLFAAAVVWIIGVIALSGYGLISTLRIHKKLQESVLFQENIWLCDHADTPFIWGIIRPRIIVPSSLSREDLTYVLAHESVHLKRHDHWWKIIGFLLLIVYWFHPLLWIGYILFSRDIELSCDEQVIRNLNKEELKAYSNALINCSSRNKILTLSPLAFGEISVKKRIQSIFHYRKSSPHTVILSIAVCLIILTGFLTNPFGLNSNLCTTQEIAGLREKFPQYFELDARHGLELYVFQYGPDYYLFDLFSKGDSPDFEDLISPFAHYADADEIKLILSAYDIPARYITVTPFQHPLSGYLGFPIDDNFTARIRKRLELD